MKNINNFPERLGTEAKEGELKNELETLNEERKEIIEEKSEFEPGTIHVLNTSLTIIEENIRKIKEKLAEFELRGGADTVEQSR